MPDQLTFDLPFRESRAKGDFFVSDANRAAVTRLEAWSDWPNKKLVLVGPKGAGKSHLAEVWADQVGALRLNVPAVVKHDITEIAEPVCLDPMTFPCTREEEEALFHLHNHLAHTDTPFLLVAQTPPVRWELKLPDLQSRMGAADVVMISEPDDALLSAVLLKLFADRQLAVAPNVIGWLVRHLDRSFESAQKIVAELDRTALSENRAVTRPLAQRIVRSLGINES